MKNGLSGSWARTPGSTRWSGRPCRREVVVLLVVVRGRGPMILWFSVRTGSYWLSRRRGSPRSSRSPAVGPAIERPGRPLLVVGREVPLPERCGGVAVALEDPGERRSVAGRSPSSRASRRRTPRPSRSRRRDGSGRTASERGSASTAPSRGTGCSAAPVGQPCVVRRLDGPPNVHGLPKPASSTRTSSTFGAASGGVGEAIRFQSGSDPANVFGWSRRTVSDGSAGGCGRARSWSCSSVYEAFALNFATRSWKPGPPRSRIHQPLTWCRVSSVRAQELYIALPNT